MQAIRGLLVAAALSVAVLGSVSQAAAQRSPLDVEPASIESREIDGARSDVGFELRILLRHLSGRFLSLRGTLQIDHASKRADIQVELDSHSVWMEKESNAEYARSTEFFDAEQHPRIRFRATAIPLSLFREGGEMAGTVELRGVTQPMTLDVDPADCERPGDDCAVVAHGSVNRSDFGMTSKTLFVGKRVDLSFRIRLHATDAGATPTAPALDNGRSR